MKTYIIPLFIFWVANGAYATYPLTYMQFGLLSPHNFVHHPVQRFREQQQFLAYPQISRNFVYQPVNYIQPQAYGYYAQPEDHRYSLYPKYITMPENSRNPVVQYIYQQPLHSAPMHYAEPMPIQETDSIQIPENESMQVQENDSMQITETQVLKKAANEELDSKYEEMADRVAASETTSTPVSTEAMSNEESKDTPESMEHESETTSSSEETLESTTAA